MLVWSVSTHPMTITIKWRETGERTKVHLPFFLGHYNLKSSNRRYIFVWWLFNTPRSTMSHHHRSATTTAAWGQLQQLQQRQQRQPAASAQGSTKTATTDRLCTTIANNDVGRNMIVGEQRAYKYAHLFSLINLLPTFSDTTVVMREVPSLSCLFFSFRRIKDGSVMKGVAVPISLR